MLRPLPCPYPPKYLEGGFGELRLVGVLGGSAGLAEYSGVGADREKDRATERRVASRGVYRTERLRLVPFDARHAPELWELHQDEGIARWDPVSREQALRFAERMESSWTRGVGKWLAYEESTGAFVGRGGPSWAVVEGTEYGEDRWAVRREAGGPGDTSAVGAVGGRGGRAWGVVEGAEYVEVGWALREEAWGRGYTTEIGRAGLDYAF